MYGVPTSTVMVSPILERYRMLDTSPPRRAAACRSLAGGSHALPALPSLENILHLPCTKRLDVVTPRPICCWDRWWYSVVQPRPSVALEAQGARICVEHLMGPLRARASLDCMRSKTASHGKWSWCDSVGRWEQTAASCLRLYTGSRSANGATIRAVFRDGSPAVRRREIRHEGITKKKEKKKKDDGK